MNADRFRTAAIGCWCGCDFFNPVLRRGDAPLPATRLALRLANGVPHLSSRFYRQAPRRVRKVQVCAEKCGRFTSEALNSSK